jgi:CHAT domain-containing protein
MKRRFLLLMSLFMLAWAIAASGLLTQASSSFGQVRGAELSALAQAAKPISPSAFNTPAVRLNLETLVKTLDRGDVLGAIRQVELGWKKQYEEYYQGQMVSQYLEPDAMRRSLAQLYRLTQHKTALVYAIPTEQHLELILVTPDRPPLHRRVGAANRKNLLELAQRFRVDVVNPNSQPKDYLSEGQQLYQWLIAPLQAELSAQSVDTLLFCLGAGLRSLPMAALHDGQQFLVERYNLAIIPAFNLLDRHPAVLNGVQVLAMGASEFQSQPPLPAVPAELTRITSQLWPGQAFLNQAFTVENLRAQRVKIPYGIVHLATHAEFLPGSVNDSYIQFWDQQLRPTQLRDLGLRAPVVQLLVLSACRTALGNSQAELGFAGLAVQSGSKATLASLWSVSDTGTYLLMSEFYRQLKTSPIKAEALRQAQLAMIRQGGAIDQTLAQRTGSSSLLPAQLPAGVASIERNNLSHPYYWAAFTLIGNPW